MFSVGFQVCNSLTLWIVLVNDLWCIFLSTPPIADCLISAGFQTCSNVEGELSCVDNLCIFCIAKVT